MQVNSEDITVAWGQARRYLDWKHAKWRMAVFQDVQESIDGSKLYFLYDPQADEQSGTSRQRKRYPGLIIFDTNFKCFAGEIPVHSPGKMKFLFALKCPSPQGGSSFVLITEEEIYGQIRLNVSRIDLSRDGLSIANVRPLIPQSLTIGGEYICSMREDQPEVVVMANPGLQIWRINCMAETAQAPVAQFQVSGADLNHFYDGFLNNGNIVFLLATPDGHFDNTRVHLLNLNNPQHITSQNIAADPLRGMPIPRKQCGIDSVTNAILVAGGEVDRGNGLERLVDYWVLNTRTFQWLQIPSQMSYPLIKPRLTACHSGNIYVWGDFDQPLIGMPQHGTHLRILRVTGLDKGSHQPAYLTYNPAPPAYPSLDEKSGGNPPANQPYGGNQGYGGGQGSQQAPPYPPYQPTQSNHESSGKDTTQKMRVNSEDITVAWGQVPHPLDSQYGKWRMAVFQDVQESIDGSKLYFLYDPQADEQSGTSGQRKGYPGLIIFDTNFKCFAGEIPVHSPGKMKFLFALKCPSPQGGSSFVLITEQEIYGQTRLNVSRIDLSQDGLSIANVRPLIPQSLTIGGEYICSMREDQPEVVILCDTDFEIWRIDCCVDEPLPPIAHIVMENTHLCHYSHAFVKDSIVVLFPIIFEGCFNTSQVDLIDLNNPQHITSQKITADSKKRVPTPRHQCGSGSNQNSILFAGGEVNLVYGVEKRLVDYWVLNTQTFQWLQIPSQMPCPLVEPRLTACHSGNIYVWGSADESILGTGGSRLRIFRVSGFKYPSTLRRSSRKRGSEKDSHPPAYPSLNEKSGGNPPCPPANQPNGGNQGYGGGQGGQQASPYPSYNPNQSNYGNAGYQGGSSNDPYGNGGYSGQPAFDQDLQGSYVLNTDGEKVYFPPQKKMNIH